MKLKCNKGQIEFLLRIIGTNALCCYPNVNGAIRKFSLNTPTASIFLQFNYFRENIWVRIWVQFHFLYIFVGRVERIYKTSHITMLSHYFFPSNLQSFWDELNRSSKTAFADIWADDDLQHIFVFLQFSLSYWQDSCIVHCNSTKSVNLFSQGLEVKAEEIHL